MTTSSEFDVAAWLSHDWVQQCEDMIASHLYSVRHWIEYLDAVDDAILEEKQKAQKTATTAADANSTPSSSLQQLLGARDWVGRRAVSHLPRSYKLWKLVWEYTVKQYDDGSDATPSSAVVMACFERALLTLSAYPRVWMAYIEWLLLPQHTTTTISFTQLRRTINRGLCSVAVTQHEKLWSCITDTLLSLEYYTTRNTNNRDVDTTTTNALQFMPWESADRLLRRYCMLKPEFTAEYAAWCEKHGRWGAAASAYQELLNSTNSSPDQQDVWQSFTELVAQHSESVESAGIPWEAILNTAIAQQLEHDEASKKKREDASIVVTSSNKSNTMLGLLYSWLASAWIQRGSFDMAVAVYEEGLLRVRTVRDFSVLYSAYLQLVEGLLTALTDSLTDDDMVDDEDDAAAAVPDNDWDLLLSSGDSNTTRNKLADMELAMARAEHLTARRPLLLNAVKLRQNGNDCGAWIERADLYVAADQPRQAAAALEEGLRTVQQSGSSSVPLSQVVIRLVKVYEDSLQDVAAARDMLDRVCRQRTTATGFSKSDDLAECWAAWIELELKHEAWDEALSLSRQSVAGDSQQRRGRNRLNLTKSLRLWDLLLDLEESLGTLQTTKDAYNRALEIKVATVQHVLNFGSFLTEQKYFEESLTAYERGIELFAFPHAGARLLWKAYLEAFLNRYKGTKVERARNLFQRCLEDCPAEECAEFFMMNGEFEEEYGLTKRALSVYRAMCEKVPPAEKYTAYQLFIAKTIKYLGVPATRDIYQEAIERLKDHASAVKMCADFAKMEVGLQQIERARAIYAYGAQSADPRRVPEYWKDWNDFEIANGNEETFREMLRVKRSVEAAFSTVNYNATGMTEKVETLSNEEAMRMIASGEGMDLEESKTAVSGFVPSKRTSAAANLDDVEERVAKLRKATAAAVAHVNANEDDDDEIDLDEIDAEIEEAAAEGESEAHLVQNVATKAVPDAVFGGLATQKAK
jgi:pre-mRNA-splicing factor SYF1